MPVLGIAGCNFAHEWLVDLVGDGGNLIIVSVKRKGETVPKVARKMRRCCLRFQTLLHRVCRRDCLLQRQDVRV